MKRELVPAPRAVSGEPSSEFRHAHSGRGSADTPRGAAKVRYGRVRAALAVAAPGVDPRLTHASIQPSTL